MKNITSTLLRQHLSACIEQLNDTDFAITKHGKVIAVLTTLERFESSADSVLEVGGFHSIHFGKSSRVEPAGT